MINGLVVEPHASVSGVLVRVDLRVFGRAGSDVDEDRVYETVTRPGRRGKEGTGSSPEAVDK